MWAYYTISKGRVGVEVIRNSHQLWFFSIIRIGKSSLVLARLYFHDSDVVSLFSCIFRMWIWRMYCSFFCPSWLRTSTVWPWPLTAKMESGMKNKIDDILICCLWIVCQVTVDRNVSYWNRRTILPLTLPVNVFLVLGYLALMQCYN